MVDTRSPEQRRRIMASVRTKHTGPELRVRKALHRMGYRFRLHRRDLPGSPDIVLPSWRVAIFVHGCFWHGHGCSKGRPPKANIEYWVTKIEQNRARDARSVHALTMLGWQVHSLWQCELKDDSALCSRLTAILGGVPGTRSTSETRPSRLLTWRLRGRCPAS